MTKALNYETFLRWSFGITNGEMLDRWGDPAGIANTDCFTEDNIDVVKAGTAYAMIITTNYLINNRTEQLEDREWERVEDFHKKVIKAKNILQIDELINNFRETVVSKYFDQKNGQISLKIP